MVAIQFLFIFAINIFKWKVVQYIAKDGNYLRYSWWWHEAFWTCPPIPHIWTLKVFTTSNIPYYLGNFNINSIVFKNVEIWIFFPNNKKFWRKLLNCQKKKKSKWVFQNTFIIWQTCVETIQHLVEILSFATPISMQLCVTKCRLQLQMVAYVTTFWIWMDFDLPFN
jgi:hypothetical protein